MNEMRPALSFCPICGFINAPGISCCISCGARLRGDGGELETAWEQFVAMVQYYGEKQQQAARGKGILRWLKRLRRK